MRVQPGKNVSVDVDVIEFEPGKNLSVSLDMIEFVVNKRGTTTRNIENVPFKLNEQEMLAFFKKHDLNEDKKLSWDELKRAFRELGVSWVRWTTDRALVNADEDDDGYISEKEMNKLVQFALKLKLTTP